MNRERIKQIFLDSGFTVKTGEVDLKEYVDKAAETLVTEARNIKVKPLEWHIDNWSNLYAQTSIGDFFINTGKRKFVYLEIETHNKTHRGIKFPTIEEAKEVAQAYVRDVVMQLIE